MMDLEHRHHDAETHPQRGAALLSVILLLGLLSLLVTSLSVYITNSATSVAIEKDRIARHALAISALEFGMGRVLSMPKGQALKGEDRIRLQSGTAKFSWRGETSRLDLNFADTDLLVPLLKSFDLNDERATQLARLIVAKRTLIQGQPVPKDYAALNGKKLGPYEHTRELLDLPGITPALFARLEPLVTVYGQSAQIDPRLADRKLIQALPNVSTPIIADILTLSDLADEDAMQRAQNMGEIGKFFDFERSNTIRFTIETDQATSGKHRFEIVAIHYRDDVEPYRILMWSAN